jgi:chromosome segregation ATPase
VAAEIEREALEARREVARLEREKAQLERRWELHESASDAANRSGSRRRDREVEASRDRAKRAEEDRERLRVRLETVEDERFELRRALEAHVGALVEAKVDNAEFQGCILELRKELGRCKVKYQRAAARSTKLEAMYHTLKDRSVERRAIGKSPENDAKKNASPYMADGRTLRPGPGPVVREPTRRSVERIDY